MKKDRLIYLAGKELTDILIASEVEELNYLLAKSEEHQVLYKKLKESWELAGDYKPVSKIDVEHSWAGFQDKIRTRSEKRIFVLHPFIKVAAAILIALGLGWFVLNPFGETKYVTGVGEELAIMLPDNSTITLNELSSLVIDEDFGSLDRRVEFIGEAYFDIAKNSEKPFIITARSSKIEVLGTSFNVDANDEDMVQVDVTSGRVSLGEFGNPQKAIILTKGMSGVLNALDNSLVSTEYMNLNFLSWRTKTLEFNDIPMNKVIDDISEYFDIEIDSKNEAILSCNLTSSFTEPTLEEVLGVISATLDLNVQKNATGYHIEGKGCTEK